MADSKSVTITYGGESERTSIPGRIQESYIHLLDDQDKSLTQLLLGSSEISERIWSKILALQTLAECNILRGFNLLGYLPTLYHWSCPLKFPTFWWRRSTVFVWYHHHYSLPTPFYFKICLGNGDNQLIMADVM